jgi:hypothetical protein
MAVDEYRFEVRLNWDRSMYYITFNTAIIAAGAGLLKLGDNGLVNLFVAAIFFLGCSCSILGILALRKGHAYYRRCIYKKTLIEEVLGIASPLATYSGEDANLAVGTTPGQARRTFILNQTDRYLNKGILRRGNVVFYVACFLGLLAVVNVAGIAVAFSVFMSHRAPYIPWP